MWGNEILKLSERKTELENDVSYIDEIKRLVKDSQSLTDVGEEQSKHIVSCIKKII